MLDDRRPQSLNFKGELSHLLQQPIVYILLQNGDDVDAASGRIESRPAPLTNPLLAPQLRAQLHDTTTLHSLAAIGSPSAP
jgi:hypothetical protein